jgi:ethanolamine utilization protein EutN/carbon dioxide concentrating mechanism protein CcmL
MKLGKVIGTVVATQKNAALEGCKLLIVRDVAPDGKLGDGYVVAIDAVGAGVGETVLTVAGSSARITPRTQDCPVDATVIGIVDTVEADGKITYRKGGE